MKKVRKLSFFGVLGVIIAVLFLVSISVTQAQVQITKGKPEKPPGKPDKNGEEATWAVRIPTIDDGYMLYGMNPDGYYPNGGDIKVSVKMNKMAGPWKKYFNFGYAFDFTLTNADVGSGNPPDDWVGFNQVPNLSLVPDDPETEENESYPDPDKPCCQFPGDPCTLSGCQNLECDPSCMADFLNGTHPHAGGAGEEDYQYFWFRVNIFDQDIESMQEGDSYLFGSSARDSSEPGDYLSIVARYRRDCYPEPAYHDVEIYRNINYLRAIGLGNPLNIVIERRYDTEYEEELGIECDGVWRIWVLPVDYQYIDGFLKVKERYCTKVKGKTKWFYPMEAKGNFSFYIDWIKNPTPTDQ